MSATIDLSSLAQSGKPGAALPARSRRKSSNPFAPIVKRVAESGETWDYPYVSTAAENGETPVLNQLESGIRQAGAAFDRHDRESGGKGWKTVVRKTYNADGSECMVSFVVKRRMTDEEAAETAESQETPAAETPGRRGRRSE